MSRWIQALYSSTSCAKINGTFSATYIQRKVWNVNLVVAFIYRAPAVLLLTQNKGKGSGCYQRDFLERKDKKDLTVSYKKWE